MNEKSDSFLRVLKTMDDLRAQCPWDKVQTNETLRLLTIEETYELADAILQGSPEDIKKELGDLLLHIVFYAKIAEENNQFDISDVCNSLVEKLVHRHPHIYSDIIVKDENEVKQNWESLKLKEGTVSSLAGVPSALPSLIKAIRIQEKARGVGFDWDHKEQVWDKVNEELNEFHHEITSDNDPVKLEDEFGDILFALVNYARFYNVNPENALEKANLKFIKRFVEMEKLIAADHITFRELTLDQMEEYWVKAKGRVG
jgi:XTP/dITP diphosphohydrolase